MICRLCLKDITEVIHIFDEIGVELNVAAVLGKYFWFQPKSDDPISTAICNPCWIKVSNFHDFYLSVEEAHRLLTERFSFSGIEQKPRKRRHQERESTYSGKVVKRDVDEEVQVEFSELLKVDCENGTSPGTHALLSAAKREQDNWENTYENDELSIDASSFLDDISKQEDDEEDEEESGADVLALPPMEVLEPRAVRRSTRVSAAANSSLSNDSTPRKPKRLNDVNEASELNHELKESTALDGKKRRGRPRKNDRDADNVSEKTKQRANDADAAIARSNYESKMKLLDEKIAQNMRLLCDTCGEEQATFAVLRKHMEKAHQCKGYAVCCNKKFYKRVLLTDHIDKHLNPECYKCEECNKVFADKQCMRNHFLLKHQPDKAKVHGCKDCDKKFAKPYLLEQHRATVHDRRTHVCDICQKNFSSLNSLTAHIKVIHSCYGTMCDVCAKVIRGRAAFERHMLEHTGIAQPKVQCEKCGSWHKDKYSLQKHKRRHNDDGKVHVCNICGKVSPNRSAMLSHQRYVHVSARNYECGVCKKSFKKPINLKEHMTMHTGEVLYSCPHCPKTFNSNANMHSHRKKMHPREFEEARRNRRENGTKSTAPAQQNSTSSPQKSATAKLPNALSADDDSMPQVITIKSDDGSETHNILVTADEFSDHEDAGASVGDNSIVFTIN